MFESRLLHLAHPPELPFHLLQSVACPFNDLWEIFIVFLDDILQHVCRKEEVAATGLSRGHRPTALLPALWGQCSQSPGLHYWEMAAIMECEGSRGRDMREQECHKGQEVPPLQAMGRGKEEKRVA